MISFKILLKVFVTFTCFSFAYAKPLIFQSPEKIIDSMNCSKMVKSILTDWKAENSWTKTPLKDGNQIELKTPTKNFGKWVRLKITENGQSVSLLSPLSQIQVDVSESCVKRVKTFKPREKQNNTAFTDEKLREFVKKNRSGIIYSWSPHMPLSIEGIKEIKKAAKKLDLPLLITLSPEGDLKWAKKVAKQRKLAANEVVPHDSMELILRGMTIHQPSIITFKNGKLARSARPGHEVSEIFYRELKEEYKK